jgi:Cu(I)/Ag(I) efflux system membrane fusion protein
MKLYKPYSLFVTGIRNITHRLLYHSLVRLVVYATLSVLVILEACKQPTKQSQQAAKQDVYYTCSMHPQVMLEHPGKCPICQMELIAVSKSNAGPSNEIHLTQQQTELANIHTDTMNTGSIGNKMTLTGTLNFDQNKIVSLSARVEGRIQKLYFKNNGDYVHKGDKVYDIYSEELNNTKQEYINALQQQNTIGNTLVDYTALVESAKNKLLLWGMTNEQIKQLGDNKPMSSLTTFFSNEDGYITTLNVTEGDYVSEGGAIMQLADLSTLWAEAQVYTSQLSSFDKNGTATVQIPDLNNLQLNGRIDLINPEINPDTRINLVRVTIPNMNKELHPGMPVYVLFNSAQHSSITLPLDAVLRNANGSTVWVEIKPGVYTARMVQTGIEDGNIIEITSGLQNGDVVVTSGAYLLNSEYIFKNGSDPMVGMKM